MPVPDALQKLGGRGMISLLKPDLRARGKALSADKTMEHIDA